MTDHAKDETYRACWMRSGAGSDARGNGELRDKDECALYTYLPLVVEAVEEARGAAS